MLRNPLSARKAKAGQNRINLKALKHFTKFLAKLCDNLNHRLKGFHNCLPTLCKSTYGLNNGAVFVFKFGDWHSVHGK